MYSIRERRLFHLHHLVVPRLGLSPTMFRKSQWFPQGTKLRCLALTFMLSLGRASCFLLRLFILSTFLSEPLSTHSFPYSIRSREAQLLLHQNWLWTYHSIVCINLVKSSLCTGDATGHHPGGGLGKLLVLPTRS